MQADLVRQQVADRAPADLARDVERAGDQPTPRSSATPPTREQLAEARRVAGDSARWLGADGRDGGAAGAGSAVRGDRRRVCAMPSLRFRQAARRRRRIRPRISAAACGMLVPGP
jgi:hypothetical protein